MSTGTYQAEAVIVTSPTNSAYSYRVETIRGMDSGTNYYQWVSKNGVFWGWLAGGE